MKWRLKTRRSPGTGDPAPERSIHGAPPPETSDSALIQRIVRRERVALEQLYERYSAHVVGLALQVQPDRMRADEIALETFWYIWKHADKLYTSSAHVETWLPSLVAGIAALPQEAAARGNSTRKPDDPQTRGLVPQS